MTPSDRTQNSRPFYSTKISILKRLISHFCTSLRIERQLILKFAVSRKLIFVEYRRLVEFYFSTKLTSAMLNRMTKLSLNETSVVRDHCAGSALKRMR